MKWDFWNLLKASAGLLVLAILLIATKHYMLGVFTIILSISIFLALN